MITAEINYNNTLIKIEELKHSLNEVQKSIENQIPQGITDNFEKSKLNLLNWVDEIDITLNEFINTENE
ncbi:MAG: hypothetical protein RJA25_1370 [Bacteroidota bacterium]|jgi:hypothetical protein